MDRKKAAISEAAGAVVIYAAAVFLHFVYPLSGASALSILFGAVNESVWEHVKIFTIAYSGFALLQFTWLDPPFRRYIAAKCIGLYALMAAMIGFFYLYTAFTGRAVWQVDVISSAVFVCAVQALTFYLETSQNRLSEYFAPAVMLLMLYYLMFFSFTIYPPKAGLFRDPISGIYGVPTEFAEN